MEKPTQTEMQERLGISQGYASLLLRGVRDPAKGLAVRIYREFGWRHRVIADLSDEQIDMLEQMFPWSPVSDRPTQSAA
jgi:transcriptional regulator with XRE-family HTH domain